MTRAFQLFQFQFDFGGVSFFSIPFLLITILRKYLIYMFDIQ